MTDCFRGWAIRLSTGTVQTEQVHNGEQLQEATIVLSLCGSGLIRPINLRFPILFTKFEQLCWRLVYG